MKAAVFDQTSVDIRAKDYLFRATGSSLKFDGFLKVYEESTEEKPEEAVGSLPKLEEKEKLLLKKLVPQSHLTEPPPRYTEASLVKELEQRGIGRPSTYAPIISTIQERGYVIKEGKSLRPTEIGQITNDLLVKHFPKILDVKFTAHMEDDLDKILTRKISWITVLKEFYVPFEASLREAEEKMEKVKKEIITEEVCPECGSKLVIRQGRYGDFLACSNYPKCKFTKNLPAKGSQEPALAETCEKCGRPMTVKHGRYGDFLACTGYPECKNIKPLLKKVGVKCPKCGAELVERRTKKGKLFYSCSNYPQCDFATWQKPMVKEGKHD
jgi:DNA topoisomerase-1